MLLAKDRKGIDYIEHVVRGQWGALERNRIIKETAAQDEYKYGGEVSIYIEQEGAGSGKDVNADLIRELAEYPVYSDSALASSMIKVGGVLLPGDAKVRRAMRFSAQCEAGNVRVVEGPWNLDFLEECCAFPHYAFCDQVDAASAGYLKLARSVPDNLVTERAAVAAEVERFGQLAANSDDGAASAMLGTLRWN